MTTRAYLILSPILKGGTLYKPGPGKVIELTEAEAEELREIGAIGEAVQNIDSGADTSALEDQDTTSAEEPRDSALGGGQPEGTGAAEPTGADTSAPDRAKARVGKKNGR